MRKVLIITYYWPPSGGVGVQRWLKFSKYLPNNNWQPIIYTPSNPQFTLRDESLLDDVHDSAIVLKQPIKEPFNFYRKIFGKKGPSVQPGIVSNNTKNSWLTDVLIWVRGNFLLPDARKYWVKPSVKYLTKYLQKNPVDVMVTTGPPHSMHLMGLRLKKRLGIPWIADFRDPWSEWDILPRLKTSSMAMRIHRRLEKSVIEHCDLLLTVSPRLSKSFEPCTTKVAFITNGFDFEPKQPASLPSEFRISHPGLLNETKDVPAFWNALESLCIERQDFRQDLVLTFAGNVSEAIKKRLTRTDSPLNSNVEFLGNITHNEVQQLYGRSYVLLMIINQTKSAPFLLPVKFFEYLQTGKFILGIGPRECDANDILKRYHKDGLIEFSDSDEIKSRILKYYEAYKLGVQPYADAAVHQYSREALTVDLASYLNELAKE